MVCYSFKIWLIFFYRLYQSSDEMEDNDCSFHSSKERWYLGLLPSVTWSGQCRVHSLSQLSSQWSASHSLSCWLGHTHLLPGGLQRPAQRHAPWTWCSEAVRWTGWWWDDEMMRWCYLRAPPWPAPTLRGCRGRGRAGGVSLPGPRPRPLTRPPRPQAAGWSLSGTRTNWKIKWETDGEDISHYTDRYLIRPSQSASAYLNISSISQSETLK